MSNPEIARLIEEDHQRLRAHKAALAAAVSQPVAAADFPEWRRTFLRDLRDFQNRLLQHFDLEEDGGFMADLIAHTPRMAGQAATLEEEHEEIVRVLDGIVSDVKRIASQSEWVDAGLRSRMDSFLMALKEHEAAECSLIQEVYYQDIGVAD
jgi:hypothetical protein